MRKNRDGRGILHWRCFRAVHRPAAPTIGFKVGTFFENANLDLKTIFKLAYLWCMNLPLEYAEFETEVAHRHVVDCHKKFRQICVRYFRAHPIRLGGGGLTVEADEILSSLLKEFNWRERFGQRNMVFYNFWSQVAALYPCQH